MDKAANLRILSIRSKFIGAFTCVLFFISIIWCECENRLWSTVRQVILPFSVFFFYNLSHILLVFIIFWAKNLNPTKYFLLYCEKSVRFFSLGHFWQILDILGYFGQIRAILGCFLRFPGSQLLGSLLNQLNILKNPYIRVFRAVPLL